MALDGVLIAGILLSLITLLILHRLRRQPTHRLPLPPGPSGFPILGALPLIGPQAHASLASLASRYGPIMYLKMGTAHVVVASTAAAARAFLKTHDLQFANRPSMPSAKDVTYDGQDFVFANYGARWRLLRRLAHRHFLGTAALAGWAAVRREEVGRMLRALRGRAGEAVEVAEAVVCANANMLGRVVLSRRVFEEPGEESGRFKASMTEMLTGAGMFNVGDFFPSIAWMDLQGVQRQLRRVQKQLDAVMEGFLAEHAATAAERETPDVLDQVIANRVDDEGTKLSDVHIKAFVTGMFTAGTDTVSVIIEWALAEMLKKPSILRRAQAELDSVICRHRRMEESDIPNLPYLRAVCKEVLRLHPSTPLSIPHFTFEACEVNGMHIPVETRLLVNVWAIGRDPEVWEAPLEFRPERFMAGEGKWAAVEPLGNDFELIPFGAGRRICVGVHAGMVMLQYTMGSLLHAFEWRPEHGMTAEDIDMEEKFGLVMPKAVALKTVVGPRLDAAAYMWECVFSERSFLRKLLKVHHRRSSHSPWHM